MCWGSFYVIQNKLEIDCQGVRLSILIERLGYNIIIFLLRMSLSRVDVILITYSLHKMLNS